MEELILIEGGDLFEGNWNQLLDCFGVGDEDNLRSLCQLYDWAYEIKLPTLH